MKRMIFSTLAVLTMIAVPAVRSSAQTTQSKFVAPGTLSDEDVAALKQTYTDPNTKKQYKWIGKLELETGKNAKQAKLRKKIAYRLTGALYEIKTIGNRQVFSRQSGTCWIYIKDADGNVVSKASKSLNTMCPS